MALTKVSRGLLSTGIVDNSNATAITLNADESATFAGSVGIGCSPSQELELKAASVPTFKLNQADTYGAEIALRGNDLDIAGSANDIVFYTGGNNDVSTTERMRIDGATGSVGIGTTVPTQSDTNSHFLYGGGSNGFNLSATEGPIALSSNVTINSGEKYVFNGFASKNYQLDGAHVWQTAASGTAGNAISFTERLRLDANGLTLTDGNVVVANGHGIDFSAQTATSATNASTTSELLDHYEEGSWTPTMNSGGNLSINKAIYTRIGNLVTASLYVIVNPTQNTVMFNIAGLPFPASPNSYYGGGSLGYAGSLNVSFWLDPLVVQGGTYLYFHRNNSNANVLNNNVPGGTPLIIHLTYTTG